ncbi:MAG: hypothetical protein HY710_00710 [Candidatus Latescibacteria bacterium]|nr:hypothetical protein [Candidatus Latescibacterota bacterium]
MTELLDRAFGEAAKLPKREQDKLARWLLREMAAERRWDDLFSRSRSRLSKLTQEALAEHREGRSRKLVPDEL